MGEGQEGQRGAPDAQRPTGAPMELGEPVTDCSFSVARAESAMCSWGGNSAAL